MPNLKIYVERARYAAREDALSEQLPALRALLCDHLAVPPAACQIAVLPVLGLADQPELNAELFILPAPARDRSSIIALAAALRDQISTAAEAPAAVRISFLDAGTYVALK
ncbi:hypothetical protein [Falsigemmobacter faecalis]|uniref:DUF1904 family protein n=1 Tax=Falsigemmobacter faecalis TaxID=2488730 RepID=A0A3P3DAD9_9RHOB|nr:hypothetical protein [Falsigemmobacter faecalis]RRH69348.1 hypothetical protein EG244_18555 [Falsigemmobacter faecalis]